MTSSKYAILAVTCLVMIGTSPTWVFADDKKPDAAEIKRRVEADIERLGSKEEAEQRIAAFDLLMLGEDAKPAMEALKIALKDPVADVRVFAAGTLLLIDQENYAGPLQVIVDHMKAAKESPFAAFVVIKEVKPTNKKFIAKLFEMVDADEYARQSIGAMMLDNVGPDAKEAIPVFLAGLEHKKVLMRLVSAETLMRIDKKNAAAIAKSMENLLATDNFYYRARAVNVLMDIDTKYSAKSFAALEAGLNSDKIPDRLAVAYTVAELFPEKIAAVVDAIAEGLKSRQRSLCADMLGSLGRKALIAKKSLITALENCDEKESHIFEIALLRIAPENITETMEVIAATRDKRSKSTKYGEQLSLFETTDKLLAIIADTEKSLKPEERREAEAKRCKELIDKLTKNQDDLTCDLHQIHAAAKLASLGPKAKSVVPDLIKMLDMRDQLLQYQCLYILGKIGPDAAEAIPALLKIHNDKKSHYLGKRLEAAEAIRAIDPAAAKKAGIR